MNYIKIKKTIVNMIPGQLSFLCFLNPKDIVSALLFLLKSHPAVSLNQRLSIIRRLYAISHAVDCRHAENEIFSFIEAIFSLSDSTPGCIVEAGCYKDGSTAKFSIAAKQANHKLIVFDSFEGLPVHDELLYKDMSARHSHAPGSFSASLGKVRRNVDRHGELEVCEFIKGWFNETMPSFSRPVSAVFLDVDLASLTHQYLYPNTLGLIKMI